MHAYKFLDTDGCTAFTGARWVPGEWVEAPAAIPCRQGVHACRAADVSIWIADTMWHVELEGEIVDAPRKLVATRGRLTGPVEGADDALHELRAVSAWRCRDRAVVALRSARHRVAARRFARATTLERLVGLGEGCDDATLSGRLGALAGDAAAAALRQAHARAPFIAACSAGHEAAGDAGDQDRFDVGYERERAFQSAWLTRRLSLT